MGVSKQINFKPSYLVIIILVLALVPGISRAQSGSDGYYFNQTGHYVKGELWAYYQSIPNATQVYGFPITEAYQDPATGITIQYFQRARFEYYPGNPLGKRIVVTPLGKLLHEEAQLQLHPNALPPRHSACLYFDETEAQTCYAFLDYYHAMGGKKVLGVALSDISYEGKLVVQYFTYARLEWHPEEPPGQRVKFGDIGSEYFKQHENPARGLWEKFITDVGFAQELIVRSSFTYPIVSPGTQQTIYVTVQDQRYMAVAGASVKITVKQPGFKDVVLELGPTNYSGIASKTFPSNRIVGLVTIDIEVTYNSLNKKTVASFRIW